MINYSDIEIKVENILDLDNEKIQPALYKLYSQMNEEKFKEIFNLPETEAIVLNGLKYIEKVISGEMSFQDLQANGKLNKLVERNNIREYWKGYHADLINKALKELGSNIEFKKITATEPTIKKNVVKPTIVRVVQEYPYVENGKDNLDKIKYYAEDENGTRYKIKNNVGEIADYFVEDYPCVNVYEPTDIKVK